MTTQTVLSILLYPLTHALLSGGAAVVLLTTPLAGIATFGVMASAAIFSTVMALPLAQELALVLMRCGRTKTGPQRP
jgi:energy-converting hydrogenase Eha subunit C